MRSSHLVSKLSLCPVLVGLLTLASCRSFLLRMFLVTFFYVFISFGFLPHFFVSAAPRPRFTQHNALARRLVSDSADIAAFLAGHNIVRAAHNAPLLTWSGELALKAAIWANMCQFKHSNGLLSYNPYGENIVAATGDFSIPAAMGTFVQDAADYNPANPTYTHFTQVVWKTTTQLGCAVSKCDGIFDRSFGKATLYVCLYNPAGNVIGDAPANVQVRFSFLKPAATF